MSIVLSFLAVVFRVFRRPSNPLYNPSRRHGYWVVRYSTGFFGVTRWDGHFWWTDNKKNYRPMKVQRFIGRAPSSERR